MEKPKQYLYRATCFRECYWLENLWKPGEVYEGNVPPGKWFNIEGTPEPELPPDDAGSDPRSNDEIRATLKEKYGASRPKSWPRKKLWADLHDLEMRNEKDESTSPTPETQQFPFKAKCGFASKTKAGVMAHERNCGKCQELMGKEDSED